MRFSLLSQSLCALITTGTAAFGALEPAGANFQVFPADVNLKFSRDRQSMVVRFTEPNGVNRDVTTEAKFSLADASKAKVENGVVLPLADGETKLVVEWQGHSSEIPVKVEQAKDEQPVSFRLDVMPVFMKNECNRCHGAARGQDGFRLSLWGFDPDGDHYRLTREQPGRRVNLALPEDSMLLTKSDGEAPHTGGKRFEKGSEPYNTMLRWLQAGAPNDGADVVKCTSLELLPGKLVLEAPGQKFRFTVRAHYSDGTDRDVTDTALFLTTNEGSAKIVDGTVTTGVRGEAFVMARYATYTVGAQVIVIPKGLQYEWPKVEERNFVDELVDAKLKNLRIVPSGICNDETFLRRAYIDIIGLLPSADEVSKFVESKDAGKRAALIDQLLGRPEFANMWALKWSELLQIRTPVQQNQGNPKSTLPYYAWIRAQLENNVPMNEVARQLIDSNGSNLEEPAVN